jgi:hypothetical protein
MPLVTRTISPWAWPAILSAAAALAMVAATSTAVAHEPEPLPAEPVAVRSDAESNCPPDLSSLVGPDDDLASAAAPAADEENVLSRSEQAEASPPPAVERAASASRSTSFLTDAQIAGIKNRLNLTPYQEQYWPAVEAALRRVAIRKTRDGITIADPGSVQRLYFAARDLVISLNVSQIREVNRLARLVGLKG